MLTVGSSRESPKRLPSEVKRGKAKFLEKHRKIKQKDQYTHKVSEMKRSVDKNDDEGPVIHVNSEGTAAEMPISKPLRKNDAVKNDTMNEKDRRNFKAEYVFNASVWVRPRQHSVAIFSYVKATHEYDLAIESVACYAALHNYTYLLTYENDLWLQRCPQKHIFFRRHCVVQYFLDQFDYILVIDADIGVLNPRWEIEEWIDPNFDIIFYERLFCKEISAASFILRNSNFSRRFLNKWLEYDDKGFSGKLSGDNPAIHVVFAELYAPYAKSEVARCMHIWDAATTYTELFTFEACLMLIVGKQRKFGKDIKIIERGRSWVRDPYITRSRWSIHRDFMFHGWKGLGMIEYDSISSANLEQLPTNNWFNPFSRPLNRENCNGSRAIYYWKRYLIVSSREIEIQLDQWDRRTRREFHESVQRINNFIAP
ncbi:hypothetical protein Tcan_14775 [Toxocara canis]|uniref:Nucleotide-diphospho-sugar transferase domain-containing protein n=1 Tax=Toxocara canis TaxID=6265 RepID=A0A0B2UW29_TOXCA|nr:hypothetical protein Tcan_14775 [Toxocara canis]